MTDPLWWIFRFEHVVDDVAMSKMSRIDFCICIVGESKLPPGSSLPILLVAPAQAGARCLWLVRARSFGARHPCLFSLASSERVTFSCVAKRKVTKEKATPHSRLTHSPCAPGTRACYGVRRQSIPGLTSNWPTSCGPSFGLFLRSLAAIEGTPIARLVRAESKAKAPHPPCRAPSPGEREKEIQRPSGVCRFCFVFAAQDAQ